MLGEAWSHLINVNAHNLGPAIRLYNNQLSLKKQTSFRQVDLILRLSKKLVTEKQLRIKII